MIKIIGGAKTGYNLYRFIMSLKIPTELFYFPNEFSNKKNIGRNFYEFMHDLNTEQRVNIFVTSETAFVNLTNADKLNLNVHYFLRNKLHLNQISQQIKTNYIKEINLDSFKFPIAIKPKESSAGKVPFKFKKINTQEELQSFNDVLEHCIIQPYLSEKQYCQMAAAGYFDGNSSSLIVVEQNNQYPKGVSAYVVNKTDDYKYLTNNISNYLNELNFRGFIEFEFKKNIDTGEFFLMDINPRTWGWFYYYLDGMQNFKEVLCDGKPVKLNMKKSWVNLPRLAMANVKGKYSNPSFSDIIKKRICYEPYF